MSRPIASAAAPASPRPGLSRRKMIALIGGGVVLAAAGSATAFLSTRRPDAALAPWDSAGAPADPRLSALSFAILAPNPHNLQPWQAELVGSDGLGIYRDPARALPETDPLDRQLTIGMGCFLELLRMAAAQDGLAVTQTLFPEGEGAGRPVAALQFGPGGAPDPLFAHVLRRHTNRQPYEDRPLAPEAAEALAAYGRLITDAAPVAALRDLTARAIEIEMRAPGPHLESVELTRIGKAEIEANPDGISLGGPFMESLALAGMLSREGIAEPGSSGFNQALSTVQASALATPAYAVLTTPGNSRVDQIGAGRDWIRLQLAATGLGLAMQPMSQALQEYPEMAGAYAEAHSLLAADGETVQMLGRVGYGPKADAAPRWSLETRLIDG